MSEITSQIWNLADDTDSHFTYNGDWELMFGNTIFDEFTGTLNGLSTDGDVFNNSVHSTKTNGTSFTFRFNGTSNFDIYASLTTTELDGSVGPDPGRADVSCVLDGEVVAINGISLSTVSSISNQKVCSGRAEPSNKEHEIGFKIRNLNRTRFSFDYIAYEPIPDAIDESNGETLLVSPDALSSSKDPGPGPQLSFDSKWKGTPNGDEAFTQSPGSLVTARFNGTAIQFYSELSGNSSSKPNSATYQLDDNSPVSFELKNPDPFNSEVWTNQMLFNLSFLHPGEHTVVVKHNGTRDGMPLTVTSFTITSLTQAEREALASPSPSTTSSSSPGPATASSIRDSGSSRTSTGAIVGGIVGGVLFLALVVACVFFWMRRRRLRQGRVLQNPEQVHNMGMAPNSAIVTPFNGLHSPISPTQSFKTTAPSSTNSYPRRDGKFSRNQDVSQDNANDITPLASGSGNDEVDRLRLGNLKLQQQVEVLRHGNPNDTVQDQEGSSQERRGQVGEADMARVPRVHEDSGWRMGGQNEEDIDDVPPNYTEA
ncbi:hypothetical protein D9758_018742 [Tetrapyrgos nigripes]|uniref:Uncharacterized protein n=1 Tax=Tetrapyrgos nigripes TaxID=182062 RepID=A0A8H5AYM5_9AGAR|nr:hypothetical protein D9758_018742 [Tetrapyrgos nigripes]